MHSSENKLNLKKNTLKTSMKFFRPKTLKLKRNPRYEKKINVNLKKKEQFRTIYFPLTTESALKEIQAGNTLVFIVNPKSNKNQIKNSVKKLYKVKIKKINTLIDLNGKKKAFVKLTSDYDALDVANKIGFI
ncbi:rpl23A (nucleomorph) [Hemiselmis andersenii]|uniref:Rpl23A n=1 Tax=Hemiselmis andersenii TaxID=464988 RepID=A9BLB5_HEMAN|nr:rpl23A [Hemiselmis andersenii]ABW98298.1 rpl23A [Hemiselmis andersenii]|mmetsp:Transcript_39315/g.91907  ORF Transcript_39315/g.91907 Transcript_39315/m.91907 type:complete len:132 (-) Transcript_39315:4958-5353(-)